MNSTIRVIQPSGVLDGTQTNQLKDEVKDIVSTGASVVLVDLKDVTFMDSSGLGALAMAFKSVQAAGGRLCLCSINQQIKLLLELTSMDQVFEVFSNRDEFTRAIEQA